MEVFSPAFIWVPRIEHRSSDLCHKGPCLLSQLTGPFGPISLSLLLPWSVLVFADSYSYHTDRQQLLSLSSLTVTILKMSGSLLRL